MNNWELMNSNRALIQEVSEQWLDLISSRKVSEEMCHAFLSEHAGLFFCDDIRTLMCASKLNLGDDHQTDFVRLIDDGSNGFIYELIEIEKPTDKIFTKHGKASQKLADALKQIEDWRDWITDNTPQSNRLFPSKSALVFQKPRYIYTIYIGRRAEMLDMGKYRRRYEDAHKVNIRSFDRLAEELRFRMFSNRSYLYSAEENSLSLEELNELVNPFSKALNGKKWKQIVASPKFNCSHSYALNASLLLEHRESNELYEQFKRLG
ncbi:Shedu anti-phage system protein SduA domain-containing protein [Vibrio coralliilyticus]|uniref:Shedu anti-phage system protein SduA domain-containing protein n=1 Tax=Vibrio coralliilyticus TaxID=190893 RepID=UPI002FD19D5C